MKNLAIGLTFLLLAPVEVCKGKCYELVDGQPVEMPCPDPSPSTSPTIEPTVEPSPIPTVIPSPIPTVTPTVIPSPIPTVTPTNDPVPPVDCKVFTPWPTGWSFLNCVDKSNKHVCGGSKPDCNENRKQGDACDGDSTSRYNGKIENWKTCECLGNKRPCPEWPKCTNGNVERAEYPPGPDPKTGHPGYWGFSCGALTDWKIPSGVEAKIDPDGIGARIKFPNKGNFNLGACRKGTNLCTFKMVKVQ